MRDSNIIKHKIHENIIKANKTDPDNSKIYIVENMDNKIYSNKEKNKWNKIIEKHKDNMFINGKNHDKLCCEVIKDYYQLIRK